MAAKKQKAEQLGLGQSPARPPERPGETSSPLPPPKWVNYQQGAERWVCQRFDALVAELTGLTLEQMPRLHEGLLLHERQWTLARRLFGIMPEVLPASYPLEDARIWEREELARFLNIAKGDHWQQELNALRGVWEAVRTKEEKSEIRNPKPEVASGLFSDDALLQKYDFARFKFRDQSEASRFVERLKVVEKLFLEPATAGMARNLLTTELQIGRLDEALMVPENLGDDWNKKTTLRKGMIEDYNKTLVLIDKLAPWFGAITGKMNFKGALAEVTSAIQQYKATGATDLIDGIFTAAEVQVECRRSVQTPEPRYRAGLVAHLSEAKANLWNPRWKSTTPLTVLKTLDRIGRECIKAHGVETGVKVPDLAKGEEYAAIETKAEG